MINWPAIEEAQDSLTKAILLLHGEDTITELDRNEILSHLEDVEYSLKQAMEER